MEDLALAVAMAAPREIRGETWLMAREAIPKLKRSAHASRFVRRRVKWLQLSQMRTELAHQRHMLKCFRPPWVDAEPELPAIPNIIDHIIRLRMHGLSFAEIGLAMRMTEAAARKQYERALQRLRRRQRELVTADARARLRMTP